jgi:hypothetical protein
MCGDGKSHKEFVCALRGEEGSGQECEKQPIYDNSLRQ